MATLQWFVRSCIVRSFRVSFVRFVYCAFVRFRFPFVSFRWFVRASCVLFVYSFRVSCVFRIVEYIVSSIKGKISPLLNSLFFVECQYTFIATAVSLLPHFIDNSCTVESHCIEMGRDRCFLLLYGRISYFERQKVQRSQENLPKDKEWYTDPGSYQFTIRTKRIVLSYYFTD
jgi:hypothetical protein